MLTIRRFAWFGWFTYISVGGKTSIGSKVRRVARGKRSSWPMPRSLETPMKPTGTLPLTLVGFWKDLEQFLFFAHRQGLRWAAFGFGHFRNASVDLLLN